MLSLADKIPKKDLDLISKKVSDKLLSAKKKCKILEEDIYLKRLGQIIERDYFPEIQKYRKHIIKDRIYSELKSGPVSNLQQDGTPFSEFGTIKSQIGSIRGEDFERPFTGASNFQATSFYNQDDIPSQIDKNEAKTNYTLSQFLNKYTSEDNASFEDILENMKRVKAKKYPWLVKTLSTSEILAIQDTINPGIEGSNHLAIQGDRLNLFGANISNIPFKNDDFVQSTIVFGNTRIAQNDKDHDLLDKKTLSRVVTQQLSGLNNGKIGADGKEILSTSALNAKPLLEGKLSKKDRNVYGLIPQTPDMSGNETPLMTWGNIQATPLIQDRNDKDDFLASAFPLGALTPFVSGFSMPDITAKEKLALKMTEKVSKRTRDEKLKAAKLQARLLTPQNGSQTPGTPYTSGTGRYKSSPFNAIYLNTPGRLDSRFKHLSPAAHLLVGNNKLRLGSLNIGSKTPRSSRKKTPRTRGGGLDDTPTPIGRR